MSLLSSSSRRLCPRTILSGMRCGASVRLSSKDADYPLKPVPIIPDVPWTPAPMPSPTSLYVWGCNLGGMLAAKEHTTPRISSPEHFPLQPINLRQPYRHVACGVDFTLIGAPESKSYVYMGSNSYMTVALHLLDAVWANEDVKDEMLPMYDPDSPEEFFHGGCGAYQLHTPYWRMTGNAQMACGRSHALFRSDDGDVYYVGRHDGPVYALPVDLVETMEAHPDRQLLAPYAVGADDKSLRRSRSTTSYAITQGIHSLMTFNKPDITMVACGFEHSLIVDHYGFMYSWGLNTDGQCGQGTSDFNCLYGQVAGPIRDVKIMDMSTCADSCIAVDLDGQVWTWGNNEYSQLMLTSTEPQISVPTKVEQSYLESAIGHDNMVRKVAMGGSFGGLIDMDGKVWTWGWGAGLGQGPQSRLSRWPRHVPLHSKAEKLVAGVNNMAVITEDGSMYAWGSALHDSVPFAAPDENLQRLAASKVSAEASDGCSNQGVWTPRLLDFHYPVIDCAVGPHHMVALVEEVEI